MGDKSVDMLLAAEKEAVSIVDSARKGTLFHTLLLF